MEKKSKRTVTFAEKALLRAIEIETSILDGENSDQLEKLENGGIETTVGSITCKYSISGDTAIVEFTYKNYLLLGFFKGKAQDSKTGLVYKGKFYKKAPSNLYRVELRNVKDGLLFNGFKFPDEDRRINSPLKNNF